MERNAENNVMKTLTVVHKILKFYDDNMDADEIDFSQLSAKALKISENRFVRIMIMLSESGYIDGIEVRENNDSTVDVIIEDSSITLDGLKYYAENALFLKATGLLPELVSAGATVASSVL